MIKLFATLIVMLVIPVFIYMNGIEGVLNYALKDTVHNYYQKVSKGTLVLLNERVAGLDANLREHVLSELKQEFAYPINLSPVSDFEFNEEQINVLDSGLTVGIETDNVTTLFARLPDTDLVWAVDMDQSTALDEVNTALGTLYLLERELLKHSVEKRPEVLKEIRASFSFDLVLKPMHLLGLTDEQLKVIERGEVLPVADGNDEYHLYKKLSDSDQVIFVPAFDMPWFFGYMNFIVLSMFLVFVSAFLLFWVWTLWRDLARIKQAAKVFGEGEYEVRVPYRKTARLSSLSRAFNQMAEETQRSIRSHKELTSAVSHELRTPVARMRFSLDMLETTDDATDRQRYVDNMNKDMEELDDLLNELLTYARFDQTGKRLEPTLQPLKPWFDNTMQSFEGLSGGIALSWNAEDVLSTDLASFDAALMSRLLSNLVQNAFRHAESKVTVTLLRTSEMTTLLVDDDGVGIPENERERLFEAFATQDSSRNKNSNGFGLGLAIVKRVATAHQGQVEIHDSPLGGAQLLVRWPTHLSLVCTSE